MYNLVWKSLRFHKALRNLLSVNCPKPGYIVSTFYIFLKCCIEYTSPGTGSELTTLVVIVTESTGRCKSNYHITTTTTAPNCSVLITLQANFSRFRN